MTADQFQRDVVDILDLLDKPCDDRMDAAVSYFRKASVTNNGLEMLRDTSVALACVASAKGYNLETIFQMALDTLESEHNA